MLDTLKQLHELKLQQAPDPHIETRISQYELSFRMQASIPEATDLSKEPEHIFDMYGKDSKNPGTYAATACSPEGWLNAACDSSSYTTQDGTNMVVSQVVFGINAEKPIKPPRRLSKT